MSVTRSPENVLGQVANLAERLERLELADRRRRFDARDDAGTLRARFGLQADGTYGLRVWNAAGVLTVDQTAA